MYSINPPGYRIVRPSRMAPPISPEVGAYLFDEMGHCDDALEGIGPNAAVVTSWFEAECQDLTEADPAYIEADEDEAFRSCTTSLILMGVKEHLSALAGTRPQLTAEQIHQAQRGRVLAAVIRIGLSSLEWANTYRQSSRYPFMGWPTEEHMICAYVASSLSEQLGGMSKTDALALKFDLRAQAIFDGDE